jgi:hypothetical protein
MLSGLSGHADGLINGHGGGHVPCKKRAHSLDDLNTGAVMKAKER